jgi:hypothetical protein
MLFFVLFALGWGALFACFVRKSIFDFNLVGRQFNWSRRGIYGKKTGIIPLDQIKSAFVEISSSDNGSTYRPVLSTSQGPFPLINYFTGGSKRRYESIAAAINAALQTNPAEAMDEQILALATSGQWIEAIEMTRKRYGYDLEQAQQFVDGIIKQRGA